MEEPHKIYYPPECATIHIRNVERWERNKQNKNVLQQAKKRMIINTFDDSRNAESFYRFVLLLLLCKKYQVYATQTAKLVTVFELFCARKLFCTWKIRIVFPLQCCARSTKILKHSLNVCDEWIWNKKPFLAIMLLL
jgi:hypothetical protein